MQIHIYTTQKVDDSSHNRRMIDLITESMPKHGLAVGAECPDVVHIWGRWNSQTVSEIKHWQRVFTPVVFSPVDGLAEICSAKGDAMRWIEKKKYIRRICQMADIVVAQGKEEQRLISQYGKKEALTILNPYVTSLTSESDCTSKMAEIYTNLYSSHDKQMIAQCESRATAITDEPIMKSLIAQTLYVEYLFHHGTCHNDNLQRLSTAYIKAEMADEDLYSTLLKRAGKLQFVGRLMALMAEKEMISEGFMPVEPIVDKHTKQLGTSVKEG